MNIDTAFKRISIPQLSAYKGQQKIVSLTAYSKLIAKIIDELIDILIVGDSTAMLAYGRPSTLAITLQQTIDHAHAVVSATHHSCVIVDMPFGSYHESPQQTFRNAAIILAESGADGIKLEGGAALAETIHFLVQRGIPVMAHIRLLPQIGIMPQHVNRTGDFRCMTTAITELIRADALAHEQAGAFSLLLEGISASLAREITHDVTIPTIGIGASPACDGQVLVTEDMLCLSAQHPPRFVKNYADISTMIRNAVASYAQDVRAGEFMQLAHY